jgi:transcriptional regulator NrdR family protein
MTQPKKLPDSQVGFLCPKCGSSTQVTDSRQAPGGTVRRRRRCLSAACHERFSTYEVLGDRYVDVLGIDAIQGTLSRIAHDVVRLQQQVQSVQSVSDQVAEARPRRRNYDE